MLLKKDNNNYIIKIIKNSEEKMSKRKFVAILLVFTILLLNSCNFFGENVDQLLKPPSLTKTRQSLQRSLSSELSDKYELIYPSSGNNRTAIIAYDIDNDKSNEAICFYKTDNSASDSSFIVFKNVENSWKKVGGINGEAQGVDRVDFADLDNDGIKEIIVGWRFMAGGETGFEIFSIKNDGVYSKFSGVYNQLCVINNKNNGLDYLVTINKNLTQRVSNASLIGKDKDKIKIINTVSIDNRIVNFLNVQTSLINNWPAIFVDEELDNQMYLTEVLTINKKGKLTNRLAQQNTAENISQRSQAITCMDINGDSIIEVPSLEPLPEYKRNGKTEHLYLVNWYSYENGSFKHVKYNYTNIVENFMVDFDDNLAKNLTVQIDNENERTYNFLNKNSNELLFKIRAFSTDEYKDNNDTKWEVIDFDSSVTYCFKASDQSSFKIGDIKKMFTIIS